MRRSRISATYYSALFDFTHLSGENTYTEVYTLSSRFGSRNRVLDHKSISLRISWDIRLPEQGAAPQKEQAPDRPLSSFSATPASQRKSQARLLRKWKLYQQV